MKWTLRAALSESDGTPSSTRLNLLILMLFTLTILALAFYFNQCKLPDVPTSFADLIKFLFGAGTAKAATSVVPEVVKAFKGAPNGPGTDQAGS